MGKRVRRVASNHKNPKPKPEVLEKIQAKYNYRIMFFSLVQEIIAKMLQKYCVCFLISRERFHTALGISLQSHNPWDPRPVTPALK